MNETPLLMNIPILRWLLKFVQLEVLLKSMGKKELT